MSEQEQLFPTVTRELAEERKRLAPKPADAFKAFSKSVFAEGALPVKTKQLIAVAVAHVTQCPYCIRGHTSAALQQGATAEESWKPSGSPPKCAPAALMHTRLWH